MVCPGKKVFIYVLQDRTASKIQTNNKVSAKYNFEIPSEIISSIHTFVRRN